MLEWRTLAALLEPSPSLRMIGKPSMNEEGLRDNVRKIVSLTLDRDIPAGEEVVRAQEPTWESPKQLLPRQETPSGGR
jgi:hypothetical protein